MATATIEKQGKPFILTPDTTVGEALAAMARGDVTVEAFQEWDADRIKAVEARARAAAAASGGVLRCKVSEKGAVSVYGLNAKWPITLYAQQWDRLAEYLPTVKAFIGDNRDKLAVPKQR